MKTNHLHFLSIFCLIFCNITLLGNHHLGNNQIQARKTVLLKIPTAEEFFIDVKKNFTGGKLFWWLATSTQQHQFFCHVRGKKRETSSIKTEDIIYDMLVKGVLTELVNSVSSEEKESSRFSFIAKQIEQFLTNKFTEIKQGGRPFNCETQTFIDNLENKDLFFKLVGRGIASQQHEKTVEVGSFLSDLEDILPPLAKKTKSE